MEGCPLHSGQEIQGERGWAAELSPRQKHSQWAWGPGGCPSLAALLEGAGGGWVLWGCSEPWKESLGWAHTQAQGPGANTAVPASQRRCQPVKHKQIYLSWHTECAEKGRATWTHTHTHTHTHTSSAEEERVWFFSASKIHTHKCVYRWESLVIYKNKFWFHQWFFLILSEKLFLS